VEPFSSAAFRPEAASRVVIRSSWASAPGAHVITAAAKQPKITLLMKKTLLLALLPAIFVAGAMLLRQPPPAPEVQFTMLSGESLVTSDLRGKVLLVNFWATYCGPCMKEMPKLVQTYRKFSPRGYEMIAVAVSRDQPDRVAAVATTLPFKVAFDGDGRLARGFGNVRVTPSTFIVDREGRIVKRYVGEPEWSELHAILEKL
jgi:peroxiredoxin